MKKPGRSQCMLTKCHECMAHYVDGRKDCESTKCPLYPYMPYAKCVPDCSWSQYNPKRAGLVTFEESKRDLSDEERKKIADRLAAVRGNKNDVEDWDEVTGDSEEEEQSEDTEILDEEW